MNTNERPVTFAPKGARWPWYPAFRFQATLTPKDGGADLVVSSKVTKGRVGLRVSLRYWWECVRRLDTGKGLT